MMVICHHFMKMATLNKNIHTCRRLTACIVAWYGRYFAEQEGLIFHGYRQLFGLINHFLNF